jgi:hypothetical protein
LWFSNVERAACSRKISARLPKEKASTNPMRRATLVMISQSGRASPGGGRNARWREMSALAVGHGAVLLAPSSGREENIRYRVVSVRVTSETTTKLHR